MGKAHPSSHARSYIPNTMFLTDYPIASDYQICPQNPQPNPQKMLIKPNRPLALRGHMTNASFKRRVVILLMPKIDRAHKNYLTPEI